MNGTPPPEPTGRQVDPRAGRPAEKSNRPRLTPLVASKAHWFKRRPDTETILNTLLLGTLTLDGLAVLALAIGGLHYAKTLYDSLGVAILFATAGANFLAICFVLYAVVSWAAAAFIAQAFVLGLALYIMVVDHYKSPKPNSCVMWIAAVIGLFALVWLFMLANRALQLFKRFTITAAILTAVVPLAGAVQFYLQSYYIPHTSQPLVDVSTELSPQSKSPQKIHLSAKVTFHNRGSVKVNVAAALMRVTAYPPTPQQQQQQQPGTQEQEPATLCGAAVNPAAKWCQIGAGLDLSGLKADKDFRSEPAPPVNAQVRYAGMLMRPGDFLLPGETDTFQRVVDIDPANVGLARLSVSTLFLTERNIKATTSCWKTRANVESDPTSFSFEVNSPIRYSDQMTVPIIDGRARSNVLCVDSEFAPRNIVERWIGNQGVLRVRIILDDPQRPDREYPRISYYYYVVDADGVPLPDPDGRIGEKLEDRNPLGAYDLPSEYAPGDPIKTGDKG